MTIPARVHFCWIGNSLPWAYVFAVLSAAARSDMAAVVLHHTDALDDGPQFRALRDAPGVTLDRLDPVACLSRAGEALGAGDGLLALYRQLASPVMRSDVLRAAILYLEGGVYLDMDTVTVASLRPLLQAAQFVGTEFIVWPAAVRASRSPLVWARHLTLDVLRKVIRRLPNGWKLFRRIEQYYFLGVNNAVMGTEPGTALFAAYLRGMLAVPAVGLGEAYALGPDLLQGIVDAHGGDDLAIARPSVFYPLPPRISEQWFRLDTGVRLANVLSADTRVAHWYASIRTKSRVAVIDPAYVRAHRDRQLYSALVWDCIPGLAELA